MRQRDNTLLLRSEKCDVMRNVGIFLASSVFRRNHYPPLRLFRAGLEIHRRIVKNVGVIL